MRLTKNFEKCDLRTYSDTLLVLLANTENAFLESGQKPGVDYSFRDIAQCASELAKAELFKDKDLILEDKDRVQPMRLDPPSAITDRKNFKYPENWNFEDYLQFLFLCGTTNTDFIRGSNGHAWRILHEKFGVPRNQAQVLNDKLTERFDSQFRELIVVLIGNHLDSRGAA